MPDRPVYTVSAVTVCSVVCCCTVSQSVIGGSATVRCVAINYLTLS